jgi:hypothetical protein
MGDPRRSARDGELIDATEEAAASTLTDPTPPDVAATVLNR